MSKELELFQELRYEYLRTIKDDKLDLIENALKNYEWLKSVISIDMFDQMPTPDDKVRFLKIMGVEL